MHFALGRRHDRARVVHSDHAAFNRVADQNAPRAPTSAPTPASVDFVSRNARTDVRTTHRAPKGTAVTHAMNLPTRGSPRWRPLGALLAATIATVLVVSGLAGATPARHVTPLSTAPVQVSHCPFSNAEVEDAVSGTDLYVEWIGCHRGSGIGFARSTNGGRTFGATQSLPGSYVSSCPKPCRFSSWDPAIAVSRTGTVYAAFMVASNGVNRPVVDVSTNHGVSFRRLGNLPVPGTGGGVGDWGDRDFIAVGPSGRLYVTWDYGPSIAQLKIVCAKGGSCSFTAGDLNAVVQTSSDGGRTWSALHPISPGFPLSGADLAPIVVQPNGTLDVLYQAFPTNHTTLALSPGAEYFTRSTDGGATWLAPVNLSSSVGTVSLTEWWIDGALSTDAKGNLYATWDTQSSTTDVGWLATSKDGGATWSAPIDVTPRNGNAEQLVESAGVGAGLADVAWQTPVAGKGYATYVRPFSIQRGWLATARRVSTRFGRPSVWPGDTFGLVALPDGARTSHGLPVAISWGSAIGSTNSEIYSTVVAP